MSDSIAAGKVVSLDYSLKNDAGEELDASSAEQPLLYLHGADNLIPGLEKALDGKAVGDALELSVPPEEGYGEKEETELQSVPKSSFPEEMPLEPGFAFAVENEAGEPVPLWIVKVEGDQVFVDMNHPLAGQTLHFKVKVLAIREATDDEKSHGHPHGPTGHEGH
jgi:FKBP-type peptidyl-prolyl cis-trans isomerase SlyD